MKKYRKVRITNKGNILLVRIKDGAYNIVNKDKKPLGKWTLSLELAETYEQENKKCNIGNS